MTVGAHISRSCTAGILLLLAGCGEAPEAPTPEDAAHADQILARAAAALGGLNRLDRIRSIETVADVTLEDRSYRVIARSLAKGPVYLRFEYPDDRQLELYSDLEGARVRENGGEVQPGTAFHGIYARGHQFHRWALFPRDDLEGFESAPPVEFYGCDCTRLLAFSPDYAAVEVYFDDTGRIYGERRVLEEEAGPHVLDFVFSDWGEIDGVPVFRSLLINDRGRFFLYRFTDIRFNALGPEDLEF